MVLNMFLFQEERYELTLGLVQVFIKVSPLPPLPFPLPFPLSPLTASSSRIASIKQLLGLLAEAVTEYAAVLCVEPSYLPALKGRGESNLLLARLALKENFDGRAVDYVSAALKDLTT